MSLILYMFLFAGTIAVCLGATLAAKPATRACQACGAETPVQAKRCRHCGYLARPV
jgi:ribosomal protein L37E